MTTFIEWAAISLTLVIVAVALALSALRVRTRNVLRADDAADVEPVPVGRRTAAASVVVLLVLLLASIAPLTLPADWRSVGVALALITAAWACCAYVASVRSRPWLLALPFLALGLEAIGGALGLELAGSVLALGAVLPLVAALVAFVHPSLSKRAPGAGGGGVFSGGDDRR